MIPFLLLIGSIAGNSVNRACESNAEREACFGICDRKLEGCYLACADDDLDCHRTCLRAHGECENVCPCGSACPSGCPCPYKSAFCNKCETTECLQFADIVKGNMNAAANPCDNFEEYACGGWTSSNSIPDDKGSLTSFAFLDQELLKTLDQSLTNDDPRGDSAVDKAQQVYAMCKDTDMIDERSTEALKYEVFLNWPTLGIYRVGDIDSLGMFGVQLQLSAALNDYGVSPLYSFYPDLDPQDSSKWLLEIGHPSLGMSQSYYLIDDTAEKSKYKDAYTGLIEKFSLKFREEMKISSEKVTDDNISKMAEKIYAFEEQIAKNMWSQTEMRDPENTQRKKHVQDIQPNDIINDWQGFLLLVSQMGANMTLSSILPRSNVILMDEKWINQTNKAVDAAGLSIADLHDFIAWRVYMSTIPYLGQEWRDTMADFNQIISGTSEKARWESCVNEVNSMMTWATGRLYVDKVFPEESKETMMAMIDELQNAFATNILDDATWMTEETKQEAQKKLEKITINVGYPEWIKSDEELNAVYESFEVRWNAYLRTVLNGKAYQSKQLFQLLWSKVDKGLWFLGPAIVNAFYSPKFNSITFPAGILQPPFFSKDMTLGMNFGGIGVVIGHEITHGFDDQGSQFDGDGNFKNWWTPIDRSNFESRVQCIKDEYSGFYFEEAGKNLNGDLTAGENVADNGGMWESAYAYSNWRERGNADKFLPGLSDTFTEEQLFYINYGQIWCSLYKEEYAKWMVDNDPHSPGRFRINGVIQNHGGFASAFGCKKGSSSVPENTCRVW